VTIPDDRTVPGREIVEPVSRMPRDRAHFGAMSASGPKRTSLVAPHMSAFGSKADMTLCGNPLSRSLSGVKRRTWVDALQMSACDPKRTLLCHCDLTGAQKVIRTTGPRRFCGGPGNNARNLNVDLSRTGSTSSNNAGCYRVDVARNLPTSRILVILFLSLRRRCTSRAPLFSLPPKALASS
jgi:hypothetical protein